MSLVVNFLVFAAGLIVGVGATLLYIQYSMYSQVGKIEEQMQQVSDLEENLMQEFDDEDRD
jgi:cell division protein FtsL